MISLNYGKYIAVASAALLTLKNAELGKPEKFDKNLPEELDNKLEITSEEIDNEASEETNYQPSEANDIARPLEEGVETAREASASASPPTKR